MPDPIVAQKSPFVQKLEPGSYWWCACGRTGHPPFCDGSHKGTGLQPVKFETTVQTTIWWCQCKHTKTPPLCDGTHKRFRI